jgi:hypothetical protein
VGIGAARQTDLYPYVWFVDLRQSQRMDVPALHGSERVLRSRAAPRGYDEEKEKDTDDESPHSRNQFFTPRGRIARPGGSGLCFHDGHSAC